MATMTSQPVPRTPSRLVRPEPEPRADTQPRRGLRLARHLLVAAAALAAGGSAQAQFIACGTVTNVWESGWFWTDCGEPYQTFPTLEITTGNDHLLGGFNFPGVNFLFDTTSVTNWRAGNVILTKRGDLFGESTVTQRGDWLAWSDNTLLLRFGSFTNSAGFRKVGGSGETTVNLIGGVFRNDKNGGTTGGVIDAQTGTIAFRGLGAGQTVFGDDSKFIGAGRVVAAMNENGFAGNLLSDNLVLESGRHLGHAARLAGGVSTNGVLSVAGGTFAGAWTFAAGTEVRAVAGANAIAWADGAGTIDNRGTVRWQRGDFGSLSGGATFLNAGSYVFEASGGGLRGQVAAPFINTGTVRAAAGVNATFDATAFTLENQGGRFAADTGALLTVIGGHFGDGSRFEGAGTVRLEGETRLAGTQVAQNLDIGNGRLVGDQAVLTGNLTWSGNSTLMGGTMRLAAGSTLTAIDLAPGGTKAWNCTGCNFTTPPGQFVNDGTIVWASALNAGIGSDGSSFVNNGTYELRTDAGFAGQLGSPLVNHGTIVKTGGTGTSTLAGGFGFTSDGTVWVRTGSIALPSGFINEGTLKGTGTFIVDGLVNHGVIAPGNSPGTLTVDGNVVLAEAGALQVELEAGTSFDRLVVTGNATLGGALALVCFGDCSYAVGDLLPILQVAGELSGTFGSLSLAGFGSGAFELLYDYAADSVSLRVTEAVGAMQPVPEPGTAAMWLAGLAVFGWMARRRAGAAA